jgi:hypothetical protein
VEELSQGLARLLHWQTSRSFDSFWKLWLTTTCFLHAPYGYTGNIGDLSVLTMSPLLDRMVGGTFHELETDAAVAPFKDNEEEFTKCFVPQISEIYEEHQGTNHSPRVEVHWVARSL